MATTAAGEDHDDVADFGYNQQARPQHRQVRELRRGVSYISILTGCFQLFYFGFAFGGPAYWWTWPMVFAGQLMVALCFAELAAQLPGGGLDLQLGQADGHRHDRLARRLDDADRLDRDDRGGGTRLPADAAADLVGFQIYGDGTGKYDFAINAVILGTVLILFTTRDQRARREADVAHQQHRRVHRADRRGAADRRCCAASITRGPDIARSRRRARARATSRGYFGAFLAASLASAYVMYGFDTASSLGEETKDPRRTAPLAILRAVIASFILGGLILLFAILSVSDINAAEIGEPGGLQYVILRRARQHDRQDLPDLRRDRRHGLLPGGAHGRRSGWRSRWRATTTCPQASASPRFDPKTKTPIVPAVIIGRACVADPGREHPASRRSSR